MISTLDKAILGTVGIVLTAGTGAASSWAWSMIRSGVPISAGNPGAIIAELSAEDGSVKTRHRDTLAWTDGLEHQSLREGDRIRTLAGAHATVRYAGGLDVTLDPNSQITVHGPVDDAGNPLVAAIDVVDGSIRAKVESGRAIALRDAAGKEQGRLTSTDGAAEITLKAPEQADGTLGMKVVAGTKVAVIDNGDTKVLSTGDERNLGLVEPLPTATLVPIVHATPVPPLDTTVPPLGTVDATTSDVRFRLTLPAGVTEILVRGKPMPVHDGQADVVVYGLASGMNNVDILYKHADGRLTRQVQRVRVQ